jgi:hypothetical protein
MVEPSGNSAFDEARSRLTAHPDAIRHAECNGLAESLSVFDRNARELIGLLEAATHEELAFELVQNVRPAPVREEFQAQLSQRLHNYLASTESLAGHARRVAEQFAPRDVRRRHRDAIDQLKGTAGAVFIKDLRNYTLHRALPALGHGLRVQRVDGTLQMTESEVGLPTERLLAWKKWRAPSKALLRDAGERLDLRPIVMDHAQASMSLNAELHDGIMESLDMDTLDRLVVEVNAALSGLDFETAKRMTDHRTAQREGRAPAERPEDFAVPRSADDRNT